MSTETENPNGTVALSSEALHARAMGIHEHALLVEAIMLNFPEIYEDSADPNPSLSPAPHGAAPSNRPSTLA